MHKLCPSAGRVVVCLNDIQAQVIVVYIQAGPAMHTMAKFLLELSLTDYPRHFLPSQLAAAALYIACKICGNGEWVGTRGIVCIMHVYDILMPAKRLPSIFTAT